jgi:hypothetical protein
VKTICTLRSFLRRDAVHYYTIQRDDRDETEADDFFSRLEYVDYGEPGIDYADELNKLVDWLEEIGEFRGAQSQYFRHEGQASALPPPSRYFRELGYNELHLRLYCYRITAKLVILFNGDFKTPGPLTAQQCPRVRPYFEQANRIARALDTYRIAKEWWPVGYELETEDDELTFEVQL